MGASAACMFGVGRGVSARPNLALRGAMTTKPNLKNRPQGRSLIGQGAVIITRLSCQEDFNVIIGI